MTWIPACGGLPIELVGPHEIDVDFVEIAHAMSHINRYVGNASTPVSVALHTLIGLEFCPTPTLAALWLLHDAHEARLGDLATPVKGALEAVAIELFDAATARSLRAVWAELVDRHDAAIHAAAGLPLPGAMERQALRLIDLRALATERRDFLTRGPAPRRPWAGLDDCVPPIEPGPKVWRWIPPPEAADRLLAAFRSHLPALRRGRRAS